MPNVPNVPGVPALASYSQQTEQLLFSDSVAFLGGATTPQWGIFQNGAPVVVADSVVDLTFRRDWTLSDYPLEQGAFESFNKVSVPFNPRIRFASGGSITDRQAMLDSIDSIAGSLDLFDVVMPEKIYTSVSIIGYDFSRAATKGVGLLVVDVTCQQVRVTAAPAFSNTKSPSGASQQNGGQVQLLTPTQAQQAKTPLVQ